jgi:hypothetical protein
MFLLKVLPDSLELGLLLWPQVAAPTTPVLVPVRAALAGVRWPQVAVAVPVRLALLLALLPHSLAAGRPSYRQPPPVKTGFEPKPYRC